MAKRDVNISREWAKLFLGIFLTLFGMGIVAYGITHDPIGQIDSSVVTTFGVVLGWAGAMFGIDSHSKIRMHEQDVEFEAKKDEQEKYFEIKKMELEQDMRKFMMRNGMEEEYDKYKDREKPDKDKEE